MIHLHRDLGAAIGARPVQGPAAVFVVIQIRIHRVCVEETHRQTSSADVVMSSPKQRRRSASILLHIEFNRDARQRFIEVEVEEAMRDVLKFPVRCPP